MSKNDIIRKVQNRIVRLLTKTKRSHRAWDKVSGMKILPIESLYKCDIAKICHKHINGNLPNTLEDKTTFEDKTISYGPFC